jgi:hypothetical protein
MTKLRREVQMTQLSTATLVEWQRHLAMAKAGPGQPITTPTTSTPDWSLLYQALTIATAAGNLAYLANDEESWRRVQATVDELIDMTESAKKTSMTTSILELGRLIQAGEDAGAPGPPPPDPEAGAKGDPRLPERQ